MRAAFSRASSRATALDGWFVAVVTLLAFALRTLPFVTRVITPHWVLPSGDADVFYHLRRIALATQAWPRVPAFDAWMDYPRGAYSGWAPLFDFVPATIAHFTGIDPQIAGVWWPPLLGALTVVPFFALTRALFGRAPAWLAALLFAGLPANIAISLLGRVDHHVAEVLLQLWVYAWLLRSLRALERGAAPRTRESVGFGLLVFACFLTWAASMLFLWVTAALACVWMLPPRPLLQARAAARHIAIAYGVAALLCVPFALEQHARGGPLFAHYELSAITPLLALVVAVGVLALLFIVAPLHADDRRGAALRAAGMLLLGALPLLVPDLRASLLDGVGFVARARDPWLAEIREFAPLLSSPHTRMFAEQHVGFGHLALPLLVVVLALRCWRARERTAADWLALLWALNVTLLAFVQCRFLYYAAPLIAATPAALLQLFAQQHARPLRIATAAAALACLAALAPAFRFYWGPLLRGQSVPQQHIDYSLLAFIGQVASATPSAGDIADAHTRPAYGVFAPWDLGHELLDLGQRAVVANNYGDAYDGRDGFADERRVFRMLDDDAAVAELLRRRDCPYLITSANAVLPTAHAPAPRPLATRLHIGNGSDLAREPGSGRFRLMVDGSGKSASGLTDYKLFAVVNGAEIVIEDMREPNLRVVTRVSGVGRAPFDYARAVSVDAAGGGRVRVSYPGTYRIAAGDRVLGEIEVPAAAIDAGASIHVGHSQR